MLCDLLLLGLPYKMDISFESNSLIQVLSRPETYSQEPTPFFCIINPYFPIPKWAQRRSNYYWFSFYDQKREDYHEVSFDTFYHFSSFWKSRLKLWPSVISIIFTVVKRKLFLLRHNYLRLISEIWVKIAFKLFIS